jgi:hypothetical protein
VLAAIGGTVLGHRRHCAWAPSAEPSSAALGRHRRSLATVGGAWPPSAALGRHRRSLSAFGGVRLPPAALGRLRRRSASIGGAWPPSAALGGARPPAAAARAAWLRLLGPCAVLSVLWDNRNGCPASRRGLSVTICPSHVSRTPSVPGLLI